MPRQQSCGVLNFYKENGKTFVLIASAGGPYFTNKKIWSIPKGLKEDNEEDIATAIREFVEETGLDLEEKDVSFLGKIKQSQNKDVACFIIERKYDLSNFISNTFKMEWPIGSGKMETFPENDELKYVEINEARKIIVKGQIKLLDMLEKVI